MDHRQEHFCRGEREKKVIDITDSDLKCVCAHKLTKVALQSEEETSEQCMVCFSKPYQVKKT